MSEITVPYGGYVWAEVLAEDCPDARAKLDEMIALHMLENDFIGINEPEYALSIERLSACAKMHYVKGADWRAALGE